MYFVFNIILSLLTFHPLFRIWPFIPVSQQAAIKIPCSFMGIWVLCILCPKLSLLIAVILYGFSVKQQKKLFLLNNKKHWLQTWNGKRVSFLKTTTKLLSSNLSLECSAMRLRLKRFLFGSSIHKCWFRRSVYKRNNENNRNIIIKINNLNLSV